MIVLDTSGLLAWLDGSERLHRRVADAMAAVEPPYLLSPFVLAELDYLLSTRVGAGAQRALLDEVGRGVYRLEPFSSADVERALAILDRFADLDAGIADASIVVLSERHHIRDLLTLDERHFRVLAPSAGGPFRLLPADV